MKYFEISDEKKDKWLDSKDLNKGFFVVDEWSNNRENEGYVYHPDTNFTSKTTIEYYVWIKDLKMGDLSDIPEECSYFDYLVYNKYLKLDDSLVIQTLEWNNSEEKTEDYDKIEMILIRNYESYHGFHTNYPIQEYAPIRKSEFIDTLEEYWTFYWGYFDLNAPLKEQEDFANVIVDEIFETWKECHDVDDIFEPEKWEDEENWGISSIVSYVKAKGGKINHI